LVGHLVGWADGWLVAFLRIFLHDGGMCVTVEFLAYSRAGPFTSSVHCRSRRTSRLHVLSRTPCLQQSIPPVSRDGAAWRTSRTMCATARQLGSQFVISQW